MCASFHVTVQSVFWAMVEAEGPRAQGRRRLQTYNEINNCKDNLGLQM